MPHRPTPPPPTLRDSKSALLEAAQAAIARNQPGSRPVARRPLPQVESSARRVFRLVLGFLLLFGSGLLVAQPAWLAGPGLPAESAAIRSASATLALVEAVGRIQAYQLAHGRLPGSLGEAGLANPAIGYRAIGADRFEVSLPAGDSTVVLRSTDPLGPVVADAITALQRRP